MPATDLKALREERAKLVTDSRAMTDKAATEKRELTAEERQADDKRWERIGAIKTDLKAAEAEESRRTRLESEEAELRESAGRRANPDDHNRDRKPGETADEFGERRGDPRRATVEYRRAYTRFLLGGERALTDAEKRDLQSDNDTQAGYFVTPERMSMDLLKNVDDLLWIRQLADKEALTDAKSLGTLRRTAKASTFAWGPELGTPTVDTTLAYGKRNLEPHYAVGEIKVSRDLLRFSTRPAEAIVREEMAINAGELEEDAFLTGDGSQKPLGVFTASTDGISTGRDVSTGNSSSAIAADNLLHVKYTLKSQYRTSASLRWLFHRDAIKQVALLKDGNGQYLWTFGLREGEPDRILGIPVAESERAPNTFTTGLYVGLLGDFKRYKIVDAIGLEMQRLDELYARSNQIGFIGRFKVDGAPMIEEAFVRVKLG